MIITKDDKLVTTNLITSQKVADIMGIEHHEVLGLINYRLGALNTLRGEVIQYKETPEAPVTLCYLNEQQASFLMHLLAQRFL